MRSTILTLLAIVLALALGILLGCIFSITWRTIPPTILREDTRPIIPVIMITGVQNGSLTGIMRGDVRFFVRDTQVLPSASGSFKAPAGSLLKNLTTVKVPAGMKFAASKRGTKYYPVASRSAQNLSPENRIYFRSAADAEAAGYVQ